jgi:NAD(P)-dependent dehydrogenase (short-subunit alcohol dehydrogenase family)/acyl carrier protein
LVGHVWQRRLRLRDFPYLEDHRIQGEVVVPGTFYLRLVLGAVEDVFGPAALELSSLGIDFQRAMVLRPGDEVGRRVQVVLAPDVDGGAQVEIHSQDAGRPDAPWTCHTRARLSREDQAAEPTPVLVAAIQARCDQELSGSEFYGRLTTAGGNDWGRRFQIVDRLHRRDGEALARLRVPSGLGAEDDVYAGLHPAVMDGWGHALAAAVPQEGTARAAGAFMGVGIERLRLLRRGGSPAWSHVQLRGDAGARVVRGDIRVLDEDGVVIVEAFGTAIEFIERGVGAEGPQDTADWLYELRWEPRPSAAVAGAAPPAAGADGPWLVFVDRQGVGEALVSHLASMGEPSVRVEAGTSYQRSSDGVFRIVPESAEDVQRLVEAIQPARCRGVIHLWSLDAAPPGAATAPGLREAEVLGCGSVIHLVQALASAAPADAPRVFMVTRGAQPVREAETMLSPLQAPMWGLGRVVLQEHFALFGGLIDLDPLASPAESASLLAREVRFPDGESQAAFRAGERHVVRLVRKKDLPVATPVRWTSNATYLITGGVGDLGLKLARFMVRQGARRLVLIGRSALPPRSEWDRADPGRRAGGQIRAIRDLEALGAQVHTAALDVADEEQLRGFLEAFAQEGWPPICGVVHAAGLLADRTIQNLDMAALDAVWRPKVAGAWALHRAFSGMPLDFFVLFSSASAVLGSIGQANYVAANTFLDVLAHYRRAQRLPATSINWGAWSDVGLAARPDRGGRLEIAGMHGIPPEQGAEMFGRLIGQSAAQVAVMPVDWPQLVKFYPMAREVPALSRLVAEEVDARRSQGSEAGASPILTELLAAAPETRIGLLSSYVHDQVAQTLRLEPSAIDVEQPMSALGLDSMMAIELKNRLEADLGLHVPMVLFLEGLAIRPFSAEVLDRFAATLAAPATAAEPIGNSA